MTKSASREKVEELRAQLNRGIEELVSGDDWQAWLDVASKFHRYSFYNTMLIAIQRPGATFVAGYRKWQELGRQVRKGEKGIRILAPCVYKVEDEESGEERRVVKGFRAVSVFDVSQTDGEPLPAPSLTALLEGDAPERLWDALAAQVGAEGFALRRGDCGPANGQTDFLARTVTVRPDVDPAQATKTLAHELAHVLMHGNGGARERAEIEAESVAYIVCQAAGLDSARYSFGYVAGWSGGNVEQVETAGKAIVETAERILGGLERALEGSEPKVLAEAVAA